MVIVPKLVGHFFPKMDLEKMIFFGLKLLGLAPYTTKFLRCDIDDQVLYRKQFDRSPPWEFYSSVLFILSMIASWLYILEHYEISSPGMKFIVLITSVSEMLSISSFAFTLSVHREESIQILNHLLKLRRRLSEWDENENLSKYFMLIPCSIILELVFIAVLVVDDFSSENLFKMFYYIAPGIVSGFILWYGFVVHIVLNEFVTLNSILTRLTQPISRASVSTIHVLPYNDEQIGLILVALRSVYTDLGRIASLISEIYSIPFFLASASFFFYLSLDIYRYAEHVFGNTVNFWFLSRRLSSAFCWMLRLFATTKIVSSTVAEAKKTGGFAQNGMVYTNSEENAHQLRDFAQYVLLTDIGFTAWGFFSLDNSFILQMTSMAVTYTIILLQYDLGAQH